MGGRHPARRAHELARFRCLKESCSPVAGRHVPVRSLALIKGHPEFGSDKKEIATVGVVNLSIPLRTPRENGFFLHAGTPPRELFGYSLGMRVQEPYAYLELRGVPADAAADVWTRVRALLPWAALRLNFGIRASEGDLQIADAPVFDGQFATAYPAALTPRPMRIEGNHQTQEADTLLFSALMEGATVQAIVEPNARPELRLACEMFASVDFEASYNAQFLALISILEIMAKPAPRPPACINIIDDAMVRMKSEADGTDDPALRQALLDMRKGASHWKAESIRSCGFRGHVARDSDKSSPSIPG